MKTLDLDCHKTGKKYHIVLSEISYFSIDTKIATRRIVIGLKTGDELHIYPDELEKLKNWELMLVHALEGVHEIKA